MALNKKSISRTKMINDDNDVNQALELFNKLNINQQSNLNFMGLIDHEKRINSQDERLAFLEKKYQEAIASPPVHAKEVKAVPCRYAEKCTNTNCIYAHPCKKVKEITQKECVFFLAGQCTKKNCGFLHKKK